MRRTILVLGACALTISACAPPTSSPPHRAASSPPPLPATASPSSSPARGVSSGIRFSHVVVVVMENKDYAQIIGNAAAPYINSLARRYGLATSYFAVAHPSLPNYLAMLGGSTFGIASDCTSCHVSSSNLIDQLAGAGISWKAYMEGLPSPCFGGAAAGEYAKKHDPFMYFDDIVHDPARCSKVVPLSDLAADLSNGRLPQFAWISPGLCHDMHDCDVAAGDRFLARLLPPVMRSLGPSGALFLTWDEGTTDAGCCGKRGGGRVAMIVAGPAVKRGTRQDVTFTHYSLLRTIESGWGLLPLRQAGCTCTELMTTFFAAH